MAKLKVTDTMRNAIAFCREKEIIIPIANLLVEFAEQEIAKLKKDKDNLIDENNHYKALVPVLEDNVEQLRNDLKQAKEIIKKLVDGIRVISDPKVELTDVNSFVAEAEQFLKENE